MSDLLEKINLDDKIAEPPKRWQNWFVSERDAIFANGEVNKAGVWPSPNLWPSKDVAISKAHEHLIHFSEWREEYGIEYIGAFPEGERP